jgi:hypothetical protein
MSKWQRLALYWFLAFVALAFAFAAGFAAFVLGCAVAIFLSGYWLGWQTRGDDEMHGFLVGLFPPEDDDPPEKARV